MTRSRGCQPSHKRGILNEQQFPFSPSHFPRCKLFYLRLKFHTARRRPALLDPFRGHETILSIAARCRFIPSRGAHGLDILYDDSLTSIITRLAPAQVRITRKQISSPRVASSSLLFISFCPPSCSRKAVLFVRVVAGRARGVSGGVHYIAFT
jgi:hypothetical protein